MMTMIALTLLLSTLVSTPALAAPADKRGLLSLLTEKKLTFAKDGFFKVCGSMGTTSRPVLHSPV